MRRSNDVIFIHPVCVKLRQARKQKRWTLRKLEKISGYDMATIGRWETGIRSPSIAQLCHWAQSLHRDVEINLEVNLQLLQRQQNV